MLTSSYHPQGGKWTNKQRVLIFGSRGIGYRDRHLMDDLRTLMPHSRTDSKMQRKDTLFVVNEIAEMKKQKLHLKEEITRLTAN